MRGRRSWFAGPNPCAIGYKHGRNKIRRLAEHLGQLLIQSLTGGGANRIDPEEERRPPPPATPVKFPAHHDLSDSIIWSASCPPPSLQTLFARVTKPTDISWDHVAALNLRVERPSSPHDLFPPKPDGSSYLPSIEPCEARSPANGHASYADATKSDATRSRLRKDFDETIAQLQLDNDTGYRIITRTPKPGTQLPKLISMRKFWESLENMSQYWDTSLDQYYDRYPESSPCQSPKRPRLDSATERDHPRTPPATPESLHDFADAAKTPLPTDDDPPNGEIRTSQAIKQYKGRRISNGKHMPDNFRVELVRTFVEGAVWPFHATVAAPRQIPVAQIGRLNVPVRQTSAVYLLPQDSTKGRKGFIQGPIFSVQVRPDTEFDECNHTDKATILDLLREMGGLMQIAEERHREGKTDVRPGEGKWWTTKARWGGGPDGEVKDQAGSSDSPSAVEAKPNRVGQSVRPFGGSLPRMAPSRKRDPLTVWKELKCGTSFWDPRTEYQAIGKDPSTPYDEIFMVSSLNHHVSIVKLTVHDAYTEYFLTGEAPQPCPSDEDWCSPRLQRTPWYDLFDVEQRVQAFQAVWGVMAYMARERRSSSPSP